LTVDKLDSLTCFDTSTTRLVPEMNSNKNQRDARYHELQ
jgi:hypothetical protein